MTRTPTSIDASESETRLYYSTIYYREGVMCHSVLELFLENRVAHVFKFVQVRHMQTNSIVVVPLIWM